MKIGELIMELGFHADTMKLNDFVRSVGELNMSSIIAGGSLAGLVDGAKNLLEGTAGLARDMRMFGTETGLSSERMNSWSKAAEQIGLKGDVVESSLRRIRDVQSNLNTNGQVDPMFMRAIAILDMHGAGITGPLENAFTQVKKAQSVFKDLTVDQQMAVSKQMFGNIQMMDFLSEGKDFWDKIDKHATISQQDIQTMKELNAEWAQFSQNLVIAGNKFATEVAPAVKEIIAELNSFVNSDFVKWAGGFIGRTGERLAIAHTYAQANDMNAQAFMQKYSPSNVGMEARAGFDKFMQSITFNIHGADPKEVASHVKQSIKEIMAEHFYQEPLRQH